MYMYFLCLIMVTANYAMGHIVYYCLMPNTHFLLQISRCDTCQRVNKKMASTTPELHPVPVKSPWYHLGVDFVGPITPTSHNGNRYILTVNDYFTKWGEAIALPSKCAQGTAEALFKVGHFLAGGVHFLRLKLAPSVHFWQLKMDLGSTFGSKKWTGGPVLTRATFSMTDHFHA